MIWEGYLVLAVVGGIILSLLFEWLSVDATLVTGLAAVVVSGVIDLEQAIRGFANPTLVALGSLYIVAGALRNTGALAVAGDFLLGEVRSVRGTLLRIFATVTPSSAFLNNTPIVAMGIPAIRSWCKRHGLSASKLLIPLSFASIFGGICTLIGTSTNLVTDGLLRSAGREGFGFFELAYVGVPCAVVGWVYLLVLAPLLLEERESAVAEDRLESADEPDDLPNSSPQEPARPREKHQVVVRDSSRLVGHRVDESDIPERFHSSVLYVLRDGEQLEAPVDTIELEAGDTLVLDTGPGFREAFEDLDDFYVTTPRGGADETAPPRELTSVDTRGMWLSVATLGTIVALAASGVVHISLGALLGAALLVGAGIIEPGEARDAIDWKVLIVIGAAIGLGEAMDASGAAEWVGRGITEVGVSFGSVGLVASVVVGTSILSQVVTNYGAVALFFPIALSIAESQGLPARPLVMGLSVSAALSFTIPIYQTNLMVYSAGNYRLTDFVRIGLPLQMLLWAVVVGVLAFGWGLGF